MKVGRINDASGGFRLELNLMELLVLHTLIEEEKIFVDINSFQFGNPRAIAKILRDFHKKIQGLVVARTPQELQIKFFKTR